MHSSRINGQPAPRSVAMVTRQFSKLGGLELYAHKLVEGLLAKEDHITVICEKSESTLAHPNLKIVTFTPPGGKMSKGEKIDYYLRVATEKVNECGPFDVVHSHHFPIHNADVVTFHNHSVFKLSENGFSWEQALNQFKAAFVPAYVKRSQVDSLLMSQSKVHLFPSEICRDDFVKRYGIKAGSRRQDALVAYPGFLMDDEPLETPAAREFPQPGQFAYLFVGRGFRKKGLDVLLGSVKILKNSKSLKNSKLLVAGLSAKKWDEIRLKRLGLTDSVEYLGFRKDMDAVYARASAIVLSSRIEPFGMAVLQAMAHGLVPIVAASCGVAEVLTHEKDALIVKNHLDAQEFSQAMERLMTDAQLYEKLSKQAIITARQQGWDNTVDVTRKAYELADLSKKQLALT